jgi:hypothetical protein
MSFPLYIVACADIPKKKNPAWESLRTRGRRCVCRSDQITVTVAELSNRNEKWKSGVCDRRAARAEAQSSPPCSFYLAIRSEESSVEDTVCRQQILIEKFLKKLDTKFEYYPEQ